MGIVKLEEYIHLLDRMLEREGLAEVERDEIFNYHTNIELISTYFDHKKHPSVLIKKLDRSPVQAMYASIDEAKKKPTTKKGKKKKFKKVMGEFGKGKLRPYHGKRNLRSKKQSGSKKEHKQALAIAFSEAGIKESKFVKENIENIQTDLTSGQRYAEYIELTSKIIKFKSYDGYELEGTLLKADEEKASLLFVHGITSSRDDSGFHSDYAKYLGENGITTLRFDYRFHGGANDGNTKLENLSLCGIVNDIDAAFSALKTESNTKAFFVVGTSFGGGLSAYWVDSNYKSEIRKVILNAPVINYENDVLERNGLVVHDLLSDKAQKQLKQTGFINSSGIHFGRGLINELKYVNGIKAIQNLGDKVVIFHGNDDEVVPLSSSKKYKSSTTQLEIIPRVGHGFGVEDDEDLDFPETKEIHQGIYKKALKIIESTL